MATDRYVANLARNYAAAVAQERAAWRSLNAIAQDEARREAARTQWLWSAQRARQLADQLKIATSPAPPAQGH